MPAPNLDEIREGVLNRMERQAQVFRLAIFAAATAEMLMLAIALWLMDWDNRTHLLILVLSVLGYTVVVLGLVGLGAHVSRTARRMIAVLESTARK